MANIIDLGDYFEKLRSFSEEDIMELPTKIAGNSTTETEKRTIPDYMKTKVLDFDELLQEQKTAFFDALATELKKLDGSLTKEAKNTFKGGDSKKINLYFDKYLFPVPYDKLEEYILLVMKKLGKEQGYDFNDLKIEFKENDNGETIAYFLHAGDKPIGFCFYLNKFDHTSPNKIKDTCGHEFGHFVVCLENPGNQPENAHGTKWMDVCKRNGVVPSAHMHNGLTKHIK